MSIGMSQVQTIRQSRKAGETIKGISRKVGISRYTVYKYLEKDDFSPEMPVRKPTRSIMDEYRPAIEGYFEEDAQSWRRQRHTAKRIYERLRDERGCTASESTLRHYVSTPKLPHLHGPIFIRANALPKMLSKRIVRAAHAISFHSSCKELRDMLLKSRCSVLSTQSTPKRHIRTRLSARHE